MLRFQLRHDCTIFSSASCPTLCHAPSCFHLHEQPFSVDCGVVAQLLRASPGFFDFVNCERTLFGETSKRES